MHLLYEQPKLIFQKGSIEIEHLEKRCILCLSWSGKIPVEDYIFTMQQLLKFIEDLKIVNLLIDARESETVEHGPWEWTESFAIQKLTKTSLRKIARIGSGFLMKETQTSLKITDLLKKHKLPFQFRYVADLNEGLEWFLEENPTDLKRTDSEEGNN